MAKAVKQLLQRRKRSTKASGGQRKDAIEQKFAKSQGQLIGPFVAKKFKVIVVIFFGLVLAACILTISRISWANYDIAETKETNYINMKPKNKKAPNPPINQKAKEKVKDAVAAEINKDFKLNILNKLNVKSFKVGETTVKVKALQHNYKSSTVRAYVLENFLSTYECDSLTAVHDRHVSHISKLDPLICFDSLETFKMNLKEIGLNRIKVSREDFVEGTTCINETFSSSLKKHMKWSYSTSFYPGESPFSLTLANRIKRATGFSPENGGKFQITSYPPNVGYKNHTDCVEGQTEKRDRFGTILVYLKDVADGGQTIFPKLGLSVVPKKGLALVWNSMTASGVCDPTSLHNAAQVIKGHKYILQRWYYYQNFPSLGKRFSEPSLPPRKQNQPRVSCDEYMFGSCRWYDEWNYDHIMEYVRNTQKYI